MKALTFFQNKRVLITGHTGFKGSYLTKILLMAGAEVTGYALKPETDPALFDLASLEKDPRLHSVIGDIRDLQALSETFHSFRPEIVFHLAAQPIVRTSFKEPVRTYETNVLGTVNVLECVRNTPGVRSVINVTTDKVYDNIEVLRPYTEEDRLDGYDPYSNSKSCSELVTHAYKRSYLDEMGIAVSTARAGNVIGGGDYSPDRILPDAVRAAKAGETLKVRHPYSTRPYQHVLEPLGAYLLIAEKTYEDPGKAGCYNIGPDPKNELMTGQMADLFKEAWGHGFTWESCPEDGPHEAGLLKLDSTKIERVFGWTPKWDARTAVEKTVAFEQAEDPIAVMEEEIAEYFSA